MHAFRNPVSKGWEEQALMGLVIWEGDILRRMHKISRRDVRRFSRFHDIRRNKDKTFEFEVNIEKVKKAGFYPGVSCVYSSAGFDGVEVFELCRQKDAVEKGFSELFNPAEATKMGELGELEPELIQGKVFSAFIAQIATSFIREKCKKIVKSGEKGAARRVDILQELEKIQAVQLSTGAWLITPLTKLQKKIFAALGLTEDGLKEHLALAPRPGAMTVHPADPSPGGKDGSSG